MGRPGILPSAGSALMEALRGGRVKYAIDTDCENIDEIAECLSGRRSHLGYAFSIEPLGVHEEIERSKQ